MQSPPYPTSRPPVHPRHQPLVADLLSQVDPDNTLAPEERERRLALAKKAHFRRLATESLKRNATELQALIDIVAHAIARQARRLAREGGAGDGDYI